MATSQHGLSKSRRRWRFRPDESPRFPVRTRSLAFLSVAALAAVLLAGCTSPSTESESTPSATAAASDDLCGAIVASGAASDAVTIEGDAGTESVATFESPLEVAELQ